MLGVVYENPHRYKSESQHNQLNTKNDDDGDEVEQNAPETVAHRLREAGLPNDRFIDVEEGRKQSFDHDRRGADVVSGNYGVYCGQGLLGVDLDNIRAWNKTPGTEDLPKTFTVSTPHDGIRRNVPMNPPMANPAARLGDGAATAYSITSSGISTPTNARTAAESADTIWSLL